MPFEMPTRTTVSEGRERRVGFELEYTGIDLEAAAAIITDLFGGRLVRESRFRFQIEDTRAGDFTVEVDTALLKDKRYQEWLSKVGIDLTGTDLEEPVEKLLMKVASTVVPHEVVTPPLPLSELYRAEELKSALMEQKAKGTGGSVIYAFGLHFNPEAPDLEVETLLSFLQSFMVMEPWIRKESGIDFSRRLTPFIDEYPPDYLEKVLDPGYRPDLDAFVGDYLECNPTRNRSLDLLPILASVRPEMVRAASKESHLIKPRPAFHYRLPNSLIDDPDWSLAKEWNRWVVVDDLACDPQKLRTLARDFLREHALSRMGFVHRWAEKVRGWIG